MRKTRFRIVFLTLFFVQVSWAESKTPAQNDPGRSNLIEKIVFADARLGNLNKAIDLLKNQVSGLQEDNQLRNEANTYYLLLGRLYYQMKEWNEAETWYSKIPLDAPEFLSAQEELLWVWLQQGQKSKLRGGLKSFSLPLFKDRIAPEAYVVRAISNLKLCYYDEAEKDIRAFLTENSKWATEIDAALKMDKPRRPPNPDWHSVLVEQALEQSNDPANTRHLEEIRDQQYRRQWKNYASILKEAIRKLRFVKLDLLIKLGQGPMQNMRSSDTTAANKLESRKFISEIGDKWAFPFDGEIWTDELFKLRSIAAKQCIPLDTGNTTEKK